MSRLSERLAKKIERELHIQCDPATFRRTYAGRNQKAAGAFLWEMNGVHGGTLGSISPASECVKSTVRLDFDAREGEIFPEKI